MDNESNKFRVSKSRLLILICFFLSFLFFGHFSFAERLLAGIIGLFIIITLVKQQPILGWSKPIEHARYLGQNEKRTIFRMRWIINHTYSEISLFLTSLTFLLVFFTNSVIRKLFVSFTKSISDPILLFLFLFIVIVFFLGAVLSIYH